MLCICILNVLTYLFHRIKFEGVRNASCGNMSLFFKMHAYFSSLYRGFKSLKLREKLLLYSNFPFYDALKRMKKKKKKKERNHFYNLFTYDQLKIFFKLCSYLQNLVIFETILHHSILSFHTYDTRFRRWLLNLPNQQRGRFGCLPPFPREHHPSIFNLSCISFSLKGAGKSDCKNNGGILSAIWRKGLSVVMEADSKLIGVCGEIRCLEPTLENGLDWTP